MAGKVNSEVKKSIEEDKYSIKDLIENCEALTGYKKEVAVGALFNYSKNEITKSEFKNIVEEFLNRKVEQ